MKDPTAFRHFSGKSGKPYIFGRVYMGDDNPMLMAAGNFIFAVETPEGMDIIYVGEAESLFRGIESLWNTAKVRWGTDLIFGHRHSDPAARMAERDDLLAQWHPPMNYVDRKPIFSQ